MSAGEETIDSKYVLVPKDGSVKAASMVKGLEKEINDDRKEIIVRLHSAYENLVDSMEPYQKQWDAGWGSALADAALTGAQAGVESWGEDFADFFKPETWTEIGGKIKELSGAAYDTMAEYAKKQYKEISEKVNKNLDEISKNPDGTICNWAWWQKKIEDVAQENIKAIQDRVKSTVKATKETIEKAKKLYKHRNAIFKLPNQIAEGDVKGIQNFVDTELMDIDPEWAKAIKEDPSFHVAIEIIGDHETALTYLAYVALMLEAVPPNFLALIAAKAGIYVLIEVVLLVVLAAISDGVLAGIRIGMLCAKIAISATRVGRIVQKAERLAKAFQAFIRILEDFADASTWLRKLGEKLKIARQRGFTTKGPTKSTLNAKRKTIKREKKCRLCGSTQHRTPSHRRGFTLYR